MKSVCSAGLGAAGGAGARAEGAEEKRERKPYPETYPEAPKEWVVWYPEDPQEGAVYWACDAGAGALAEHERRAWTGERQAVVVQGSIIRRTRRAMGVMPAERESFMRV